MYCSKCGKEVRDGAAFCPHCGAPLAQAEPEEYEYEEYDEPAVAVRKGLSTGVIIAIIAAAALVLLAGILAFTSLTHSKQQAQIAQMEAQVAQAEAEAEKAKQEAEKAKAEQQTAQEQQIQDQVAQEQANAAAQQQAQASQPQTVNNYYYYGTGYASGSYYSSVKSSGYLWPTDTQYITRADLSGYDSDTVAAIRNEIYARHGYAFQTQRWKNYFGSKSWYVRDNSCTQSVALSRMNKIERANVDTIVKYEQDMGWK
jgi:flagellar basal body-associated protein FliL